MELAGTYDPFLVIISILAACGAAFVAVSTVPRIHRADTRKSANLWALAFGLSLGSGLWSMHFIAMLALNLPVGVHYDIPLTAISLLVAIIFAMLGVLPFRMGGNLTGIKLAFTGSYMGLGIAGMHYTGMAAMHLQADMVFDHLLVSISIVVAIVASTAALWIADRLRNVPVFESTLLKIGASILMGMAVSGMHYTGMAASRFLANVSDSDAMQGLDATLLVATLVAVGGLLQAGVLFFAERDEARHAWRKLQENKTNLLNLLNMLPDGIVVHIDGVIVYANPAALALVQMSSADMIGTHIMQYLPDENRQRIEQWMNQSEIHDHLPLSADERILRPDGSSFNARMNILAMRWNGQPATQLILHDLTDEKRRLSELARLITAVNHASDIIFSLDAGGHVLTVNRTGLDFIGKPLNEIQGRTFNEFVPPESLATAEDMFDRKARGDAEKTHYELMMRDRNGKAHDMEVRTRAISEDDSFAGVVAVARDVTLEKEQQSKLEHTQRLESLGVLAGGIAHDFNNLLTAILGNAALAERKMLKRPQEIGPHLLNIVNSSEKAADLCKQMLAYSGKGRFVIRNINLSHLVEEIGNLLQVSIAKNVNLQLHLADDLPDVQADVAQIQQVVMNLLINASDAIGEKNGNISISTGMTDVDEAYLSGAHAADDVKPGRFVCLEVSDNGSGMERSVQDKLFDPFFTTKFTGRGLGMSAVLGIVRGHHGAIRVYSEPGKGTTFKILFPGSQESDALQDENTLPESHLPSSGTVLIVDDEESVRNTAMLMLEDMGFTTLHAEDGVQGVVVYREHQADIIAVLLDMTMPNMDGKTCFSELKRINPRVRVLLSSGYNEQETINRFAGQGLAGFLQKPYTPDALKEKMREVLNT